MLGQRVVDSGNDECRLVSDNSLPLPPYLFFIPTWAWDSDPGYGFKTERRATILLGSGFGRVPAWVMEKALG